MTAFTRLAHSAETSSTRWPRIGVTLALFLAMWLAPAPSSVLAAPSVPGQLASLQAPTWSHLDNNFDHSSADYRCGRTYPDTGSKIFPCVYYNQPNDTSIRVYGYIDSALYPPDGAYDFRASINQAMASWNGVTTAFNPFYYSCYKYQGNGYGKCGQVIYEGSTTLPFCEPANTITYYAPPPYSYSAALGQYYTTVLYTVTQIDTTGQVVWDTSETNTCNYPTAYTDVNQAVAHETGHSEGMGHSGVTQALMNPYQNNCSCSEPQYDDISGLNHLYPGYYPSGV